MYMKVTAKSHSLQRAADFHVILPYHDGYPDGNPPYPTLYLLTGYSGNAEEILFTLPLRQMSALYGIAVVVPDGENLFYTDHPERATCMGQYAGDELVRITRRLFPCLSRDREQTYIGGISMGGYGAAVLGLHYRDTFSKQVLFSPSVEPDRLLSGEKHRLPCSIRCWAEAKPMPPAKGSTPAGLWKPARPKEGRFRTSGCAAGSRTCWWAIPAPVSGKRSSALA